MPESDGNNDAKNLEELTQRRNKFMTKAGKALRKIEIIMGEFSGLGLCDIIAILGTLYVIPKENLLGFLDKDAFSRMQILLNRPEATQSTLPESMIALTNLVKDFYNLMDKFSNKCSPKKVISESKTGNGNKLFNDCAKI